MFGWLFNRGKDKAARHTGTKFSYVCACCGETHVGLPAFGQTYPPSYLSMPEEFRDNHATISEDLCRIAPYPDSGLEDPIHFVRGVFTIPIIEHEDTLELGLWFSQSEESYRRYRETFSEDQSDFGSFAWATPDSVEFRDLEADGSLLSTACDLYGDVEGKRPHGHAHSGQSTRLATLQMQGITRDEVIAIMTDILHPKL